MSTVDEGAPRRRAATSERYVALDELVRVKFLVAHQSPNARRKVGTDGT